MSRIPKRRSGKKEMGVGVKKRKKEREKHFWNKPVLLTGLQDVLWFPCKRREN